MFERSAWSVRLHRRAPQAPFSVSLALIIVNRGAGATGNGNGNGVGRTSADGCILINEQSSFAHRLAGALT